MARRELVGLTLAPAVLAAIWWLPAWVFLTVLGGVLLLAADEMLRMAMGAGIDSGRVAPVAATAAILAGGWVFGTLGLVTAVGAVLVVLPALRHRRRALSPAWPWPPTPRSTSASLAPASGGSGPSRKSTSAFGW